MDRSWRASTFRDITAGAAVEKPDHVIGD